MKLTVDQVAALVHGRVIGDGNAVIDGVAGLLEAGRSDASFVRDAKNASVMKALSATAAGAVFVPNGVPSNGKTVIEVKNPMAAFAVLLGLVAKENEIKRADGVHPTAVVAPSASIEKGVQVGPLCVIEEGAVIGANTKLIAQVYVGPRVKVGADTLLYPQVTLREGVAVGQRCIIHSGAVVGSDGYGFYFSEGKHNKIPQIGTVVIEDDVEIGACTAIDRATTGGTIIKKGSKLDNLVHIAHNVEVGPHALLAAQVGIAGSTKIGQGVAMGGQVGVADHAVVGDGVQLGAQSGVKGDIPAGEIYFGSPAQPIQETLRQIMLIRKLPDLFKKLPRLFKDVDNLKGRVGIQ